MHSNLSSPRDNPQNPSAVEEMTVGGAADHGQFLGGTSGTPPSNTVPNNCNPDDLPYIQLLRWGVDSLYLSVKGRLSQESEIKLTQLKKLAQSEKPADVALAQLPLGRHLFEVKDKGTGLFTYVIEDNAFRIQFSKKASKSLPMAYVKVSSHYLTCRSPWEVETELRELLSELGTQLEVTKVSRIDLFVDFVSSVDMESWTREAWVTKAQSINAYSVKGKFSGWTIGQGGAISARLYDKQLEIVTHSHKDYLFKHWLKAGWSGQGSVWRLEFQYKQEVLSQLGIKGFDAVMARLGAIWGYATVDWLKLTQPNPNDATRSRWPIHPLWCFLADVDWEDDGGDLERTYPVNRVPSEDYLLNSALNSLTSFMASQEVYRLDEGIELLRTALGDYYAKKAFMYGQSLSEYVWDRVALKIREYNKRVNAQELTEAEQKQRGLHSTADAYRRARDGE